MNYEGVKKYILTRLERELNPDLTYHSVSHTIDVLQSAIRLAGMENVNGDELLLLQTACLFHDTGMLKTYRGHEEASAEICQEILPGYGYSVNEIEVIIGMVLTTKLPQCARHNLDKILCDADLDYLGRPDYFMIAHKLRYEWYILGLHNTTLHQWYKIQKDFLTNHRYFTKSAIGLRQEGKLENLKQVEMILNHEK